MTQPMTIVAAVLLLLPLAAVPARGEEKVPTAKEVMMAEGNPPVIPHKVGVRMTGKECLACHETGKKNAPVTSHPERKMCTQCHVAAAPEKRSGKKR